jgi:hypothetical protein
LKMASRRPLVRNYSIEAQALVTMALGGSAS